MRCPPRFVNLALHALPNNLPPGQWNSFVTFLDAVVSTDGRPLSGEKQFHAKVLALSTGAPIQMANAVIRAELIMPLEEEDAVHMREKRLQFLQSVFDSLCSRQ